MHFVYQFLAINVLIYNAIKKVLNTEILKTKLID